MISALKPLLPTLVFMTGGAFLLLVSVLGSRRSVWSGIMVWLGAAVMAGVGAFGIVGLSLGLDVSFWAPALILCGVYLCFFVAPSRGLVRVSQSLRSRLGTARARSFAVALCCGAATAVSLAIYLNNAGIPEDLLFVPDPPPEAVALEDIDNVTAFTDRGRRILLKTNVLPNAGKLDPVTLRQQIDLLTRHGLRDQVIHVSSGWQNCNCHGWVFSSGQFWVGGEQVDAILEDNRYQAVATPRPGDVAVYRDEQEKVTHTGIVLCINPASHLILVESKWGALGRFIHPHDMHCYGANDCTFYRSPRAGHRLRGIPVEGSSPVPDSPVEYIPASRASLNPS
ncbi:MAG: hypothetical protein U0793_21405 [Gemmataceae bacterium]